MAAILEYTLAMTSIIYVRALPLDYCFHVSFAVISYLTMI